MKEVMVYHGGTEIVERPDCKCRRRNLDFGQGFYVTDIRKQAEDWAKLMADLMDKATALRRLSEHQPNNQMCLLNQGITDKYLIFDGTAEIQ